MAIFILPKKDLDECSENYPLFIFGFFFLPGYLVETSPGLSPDKAETRKNLDMPRLSETSIKDRLAKYQAAVSKQGSSSGTIPMVSLGLGGSEFLSQPETGKKILWKPGCLRVTLFFLENSSVPTGVISDEELSLHTAGRNKYICIFLE